MKAARKTLAGVSKGMRGRMRTGMGAGLLLMLVACGSDGDDAVPDTASGSLEQLAAKARCKPDIQTDAAELRQATCDKGARRYVLVTFTNARGQAEWFDEATDYGGTYLVGKKWIAVGEEKVVMRLRGRLGGTVEKSSHHSGSSGGGDHEDKSPGQSGHSGHHTS
ncbi:lipoprotein [Streptomyces rectiviolaceus]|uniref:Lipoprotein n=2 Tax=Streptomyces rectiviolaceus TaxID=332591 RepID=A0ABP6M8F7_9ACTN